MSIPVRKSVNISDISIVGAQYSVDANKNMVFVIPANGVATITAKFTLEREGVSDTQSTQLVSVVYYYTVGAVALLPFSIAPTVTELLHDPESYAQTPTALPTNYATTGTGLVALTPAKLTMTSSTAYPIVLGDVVDGFNYISTVIYHAGTSATTVTLHDIVVDYTLDRTA